MRFFEFASTVQDTMESNLETILWNLRQTYKDKKVSPKFNTEAFINLVKKSGVSNFNYQALVDANESQPAVQSQIKNFNQDYVELASVNGEEETESDLNVQTPDGEIPPTDTVDQMAKNAAERRGMPMTSNDEEIPPQ